MRPRCPNCGTFRITKLKERDKIDPMVGGVLNLLERMAAGNLYHCCFCRLQFYDRRRMGSVAETESDAAVEALPATQEILTSQPDTARSDA